MRSQNLGIPLRKQLPGSRRFGGRKVERQRYRLRASQWSSLYSGEPHRSKPGMSARDRARAGSSAAGFALPGASQVSATKGLRVASVLALTRWLEVAARQRLPMMIAPTAMPAPSSANADHNRRRRNISGRRTVPIRRIRGRSHHTTAQRQQGGRSDCQTQHNEHPFFDTALIWR